VKRSASAESLNAVYLFAVAVTVKQKSHIPIIRYMAFFMVVVVVVVVIKMLQKIYCLTESLKNVTNPSTAP
jgi:hypothetical protein